MRRYRLLFALFLGLCVCRSADERLKERRERLSVYYKINSVKFNELQGYLELEYLRRNKSRVGLEFLNCHVDKKIILSQICDERIIDYLIELGLSKVNGRMNLHCDEQWLNTTYFAVSDEANPSATFIYSACGSGISFESKDIQYYPIDGHWAVQFEE